NLEAIRQAAGIEPMVFQGVQPPDAVGLAPHIQGRARAEAIGVCHDVSSCRLRPGPQCGTAGPLIRPILHPRAREKRSGNPQTWACARARRIGRPTTGCAPGLSGDSSPCPSTLVPFPFSWSLSMAFPAFFAQAPRIALHDPLAQLLGASDDGLIEYGYEDAVRLAGHSCPTVAGAWLMTVRALRALYPDAPPQRGDIEATFA